MTGVVDKSESVRCSGRRSQRGMVEAHEVNGMRKQKATRVREGNRKERRESTTEMVHSSKRVEEGAVEGQNRDR